MLSIITHHACGMACWTCTWSPSSCLWCSSWCLITERKYTSVSHNSAWRLSSNVNTFHNREITCQLKRSLLYFHVNAPLDNGNGRMGVSVTLKMMHITGTWQPINRTGLYSWSNWMTTKMVMYIPNARTEETTQRLFINLIQHKTTKLLITSSEYDKVCYRLG